MGTRDEELSEHEYDPSPARAFTTNQLVACPACSRTNAPTRAKCLYCGSALGTNVAAAAPSPPVIADSLPATTAPAATSAEGLFHVVAHLNEQQRTEATNPSVARLLQLTPPELSALLNGNVAPLTTATSATQAQAIASQLNSAGVNTVIVSEDDLKVRTGPQEIATLGLDDASVVALAHRTGARITTSWDDVMLIVVGRIYSTTTEVEQTRLRKQVLDERQLMTDEAVLDLYHRGDAPGLRIRAGNFDFSCLGSEKRPTAFENFRMLVERLRRKATNARFDEDYVRMRPVLNKVWPLQPTGSSWDRKRTAIRETRTTATVSDNEVQFTRYSRLHRFLHAASRQDDAR